MEELGCIALIALGCVAVGAAVAVVVMMLL